MKKSPEPEDPLRRLVELARTRSSAEAGAGRDEQPTEVLLGRLRAALLTQDLAPEELELAWEIAVSGDPRPLVDQLIQLRVRRALEQVLGTAPPVLLLRGEPPGAAAGEDAAQDELARTRVERVSERLSASLGLDRGGEPRPEGRELLAAGPVVLADAAGRRELEQQLGDSVVRFEADPAGLAGSDAPELSGTLGGVECAGVLDEIEKVVLWSVSAHEDHTRWRESFGSLVGTELGGKYTIEKKVGQGGFGTVYRARDKVLGALVAIKVLNPGFGRRRDALEGFLAEAKRLTAFDHPNIVRWITFDRTADGLHYFVMEFLDGEELETVMRRERALAPMRAAKILLQILDALRRAHNLQDGIALLHLDLKPQNVFLLPETAVESERVKVIDFGISRFSRDDEFSGARAPGPGVRDRRVLGRDGRTVRRIAGGTVLYASPEQCRHILGDEDLVELDGRTDIYSLGVVGFKMLTGEWPFPRPATELEALKNHLEVPPKRVQDLKGGVPKKLAAFVDKALAKDREARWQSADEAYAALDAIVHPVISRRRFAAMVVALLALAAAVVYAAGRPPETVDVDFLARPFDAAERPLSDATLKLRAGGRSIELEPRGRALDAGSPPRLVNRDGEGVPGFAVSVEDGRVRLRCTDPRLAGADWSDFARLVWTTDEGPHASRLFQLEPVPPLALVPPAGHTSTLEIPGLAQEALAGLGPILVETELFLVLRLADPHAVLPADAAVLVAPALGGRGGLVPFELSGRSADVVTFRLPLERLASLCSGTSGGDARVVGTVEVHDVFGESLALEPPLELWLTRAGTRVEIEQVVCEDPEGNVFRAKRRGGTEHLFRPSVGDSQATLRVLGALPNGWRDPIFDVVATDVDGESVTLIPAIARSGEPHSGKQGFQLSFGLSALDAFGGEPVDLKIGVREKLAVRDSSDSEDSVSLQLLIEPLPRLEFSCVPAGSDARARPLLPDGRTLVRSGPHLLRVAGIPNAEAWSVSLASDLDEGHGAVYAMRGGEPAFDVPPEVGGFVLHLAFYDDASGAAGDTPIARYRFELEVDDRLELVARDFADQPWRPEAVGPDGRGGLLLSARAGAPLAFARASLERNGVRSGGSGAIPPILPITPVTGGRARIALKDVMHGAWVDGDYLLRVEGRDELGNEDDFEGRFTIDAAGPELRVLVPGDHWEPELGRYVLEISARDGNGIDLESAQVQLRGESQSGAWAMGPVALEAPRSAEAGAAIVEFARFVAQVQLEPLHSHCDVVLDFEAQDRAGSTGRASVSTRVGKVRHAYLPRSAHENRGRDPVAMVLVEPPEDGAYVVAEYEMANPADRERFRAGLVQRGAFYADGIDFDQYTRRLESESIDERSIAAGDIGPFYLDEHEVSRAQYRTFLEAVDGHGALDWGALGVPDYPAAARREALFEQCSAQPERPVEDVAWIEAWAYAEWAGKRLPTYLEWELAVRGRDRTRFFAAEHAGVRALVPRQGVEPRSERCFAHVGVGLSAGVMEGLDRSPEGLWNLCGNVAEWTATSLHAARGPAGPLASFDPRTTALAEEYFWLVGADYSPRRALADGRSQWPEHDYRSARPARHSLPSEDRPVAGFRCALDAALLVPLDR